MKIKLFIITLLLFSMGYAKEKKINKIPEKQKTEKSQILEIFYVHIDNPLGFKIINGNIDSHIGIGFRQIFKKNGLDFNIGFEPVGLIKSIFKKINYSLNINYLRFFTENKYFIGIGFALNGIMRSDYFFTLRSPSLIFGKQIYNNNKIYLLELKINSPIHTSLISDRYKISNKYREKRFFTPNIFISTGLGF